MADNSSLKRLQLDYLEYLEIERNVSSYTIRNYRHYLDRFIEWMQDVSEKQSVQSINTALIRKYRVYLSRFVNENDEPLSKATQSYHVIALRSWFKWMNRNDIEVMAAEKIELPKAESKSLTYLTIEQLERLLNQPSLSSVIGLRDRAIMELLFSSGLRVSELVSLDREDIDFENREFSVVGKGRKRRVVFLSSRAANWLSRYLDTREDLWVPLFVRYSRKQAPLSSEGENMRLSARSVQRIVEKYRKKARLPVKITPHGLRHTFATDLLSKGAGLREVQEMLGHKNVSTTQVYTHVTNPQLKKVHDKYHTGND